MNLLSLENVSKNYGDKQLFANVSLGVESGERLGLIGVNGSGKTTLLRVIAGDEPPDEGRVTLGSGVRVSFLPQNPQLDDELTVLAQLFRGEDATLSLIEEYERASEALAHAPDDAALLARLSDLSSRMEVAGAWEIERRAQAILSKLGLPDPLMRVGTLSGGQRRRVALAGALLNESDLLILDEPTNHLDTEMVAWLEEELKRYSGALLLVTHDRYFLDRIVGRMLELDRGEVFSYAGNYARYLEQRAHRLVLEASSELARQNLIRKELEWLNRGARARTTKQKAHVERAEALVNSAGPARQRDLAISVESRRIGKRVLELRGVSKGYGGRELIKDFSYTVEPGEKLGIIGPNGGGKTTLLEMIVGRVKPDSGTITLGDTVHWSYYDQESAGLNERVRVVDYVREAAEVTVSGEGALLTATQMLERFLFPSSAQYAYIGTLSGGERRRLYLLRTLLLAPNLLILDEPTNDLDIQTLTVLEDYLDTFSGSLIAVSHDRYFLDRTVERLLVFDGVGGIRLFPGGYTMYRGMADSAPSPVGASTQQASRPAPTSRPAPAKQAPAPAKRVTYKERRELASVEERIAALEARQATLGNELNAPGKSYTAYHELSEQLAQINVELDAAMERWAELAELVAE
jgi:ATP-binding cassette subfamily F protein uup